MRATCSAAIAAFLAISPWLSACARVTTVESVEEPVLVLVGHPPALPPDPEPPPPPPPPPPKLELAANAIVLLEPIEFRQADAVLNEDSAPVIDELVDLLRANSRLRLISIEAHTGPEGSKRALQKLSKARADAVRDRLTTAGVAPERLQIEGWGKSRPLPVEPSEDAPNPKPMPTARVELLILEQDPATETAPVAEPPQATADEAIATGDSP